MDENRRGAPGSQEVAHQKNQDADPPDEEGLAWSDVITWAIFLIPVIALLVLWIISIKTN